MQQADFRKPTLPERALSRFGYGRDRAMFWSFYEPRNFGDWIGPYLFHKITGRPPFFRGPRAGAPTVFAAGSIMRWIKAPDSAIVWGSGIISRDDAFERPKEIRAVRGPLTRARCLALSYDCPEVYGDPGILLPRVYRPHAPAHRARLGVIPHYVEQDLARRVVPDDPGIRIIDVTAPIEEIVDRIAACDMVISSSLHGLIVAHAYGVPAGRVVFSDRDNPRIAGDGVKFHDYALAFGGDLPAEPLTLGSARDFSALALEKHVSRSPIPDHADVAARLWACRPFGAAKRN